MVTDQHPKGDILPWLIGVMQTHIRKEGRRVWIRKRKGCVLVTLLRKLKLNQLTAARTILVTQTSLKHETNELKPGRDQRAAQVTGQQMWNLPSVG